MKIMHTNVKLLNVVFFIYKHNFVAKAKLYIVNKGIGGNFMATVLTDNMN